MKNPNKLFIIIITTVTLLAVACRNSPTDAPVEIGADMCPHPTTELEQPFSTYLPLAKDNTWTYHKTVNGEVLAWEAYTEGTSGLTKLVVGSAQSITTGEFEETYRVIAEADRPGLWEIAVPDVSARDGRYGDLYTHPDKIWWGRVPSSEDVIEIDEVMRWESAFLGHVEQSVVFLVEARLPNVEVSLFPLDDVTYTTRISPSLIETPAGSYVCTLEVVMTVDSELYDWQTYSYFAPGVGLVQEYQLNQDGEQTYIMELTDYKLK